MLIKQIKAQEILNSLGSPTIECSIVLDSGKKVVASVPSGTSESKYAAYVLTDGDLSRYLGKGVRKAIANIEGIIAPVIVGSNPDVLDIDARLLEMDGTDDKSRLGANAMLAVSLTVLKAQALVLDIPLYRVIAHLTHTKSPQIPLVMFNMINGGMHSDSGLAFQEFLVMPQKEVFAESLQCAAEIYFYLKKICKDNGYGASLGVEGGVAPRCKGEGLKKERAAIDLLIEAIQKAGYQPGRDVMLCLDVAASTFYNAEKKEYLLGKERFSAGDLTNFYEQLTSAYPIYSIEDGLAQDDWEGWHLAYSRLSDHIQLVGDDIFATNQKRVEQACHQGIANACLIKPNQIGTISETFKCIAVAKAAGYKTVVSHRSGETNDSFIADLAVGVGSGQFKAGACVQGERVAKYNRLLEIEQELRRK